MIIKDIKFLRTKSVPITLEEGKKIIKELQKIFHKEIAETGIGLCAIQIGRPKRVFYINFRNQIKNIINPELIKVSSQESGMKEGCLSIPFTIRNQINIVRPKKVKLKYTDFEGNTIIEKFDGTLARAIQHEMDHLNGKLIIDYVDEELRQKILEEDNEKILQV